MQKFIALLKALVRTYVHTETVKKKRKLVIVIVVVVASSSSSSSVCKVEKVLVFSIRVSKTYITT